MVDEFTLVEDPTLGDPYDDLDEVEVVDVEVPEGSSRFVARITDTPSPDLDLFVGRYSEPGEVDPADEVCFSASAGSDESCEVLDPEPGTYWVLVQNWEGTTPTAADPVELTTAVVAGVAQGNFEADVARRGRGW